jgi:hypothetical protein
MHNIGFPFKGIVSREKYFIEGPKNQISTFCMRADGVHKIAMKSITNFEISASNPPQKLVPASR